MPAKPRKPIKMSVKDLLDLPVSFDVVTAGRAFGLGRELSYALVQRDDFPCTVRKVGQRFKVYKTDLFLALRLNFDGTPLTSASTTDAVTEPPASNVA